MSFIAYTFMLFFGATILVNINPDANYDYHRQWAQRKGLEMQWVFVDDAGQKYDLDAPIIGSEHGAAQTYDYLLPSSGASSTKIDQKSDPNAQLPDDGAKRVIRGYQYLSEDIEDRRGFINAVYTYLVSGKLTALPEGSVRYVVAMYGLD